jgi:hypothetical protein
MSTTNDTVTLREAVEQQLRDLAANKPGFLEQVVVDPKGTVEPLIRAALDDDGELDLADVAVNVHVSKPQSLDFVLALDADDSAEVSGFSKGVAQVGLGFVDRPVSRPPRIGLPTTGSACSGSDATCHTDSGDTNYCGGCR